MPTVQQKRLLFTGQRPLLRATFTAANGTAVGSYTPEIGPVGVNRSGTFQITGNKLVKATGSGQDYETHDIGVADVAVAATLALASGTPGAGLIVRSTGAPAGGYWLVTANAGAGIWQILEFDGVSTFTQRASGGVAAASTSYRLAVLCQGVTITACVDGVQVATYASATRNQTATQVGPRVFGADTTTSFDDPAAWRAGQVTFPTGVV